MSGKKKNNLSTAQLITIIIGCVVAMWGIGLLVYTQGIVLHPGKPTFLSTLWSHVEGFHDTYSTVVVLGIVVYFVVQIKQGRIRNFFSKTAEPIRLTLSTSDKRIAGVCGGLAYWLGCGSASIRIVLLLLFTVSPGIIVIAYIALALVLSRE